MRRKILKVETASPTHKFIRTLRDGGRLVHYYTQNIDGLERREGLCSDLSRIKSNQQQHSGKMPNPLGLSAPESARIEPDRGCEVVQLRGNLEKLKCPSCSLLYFWIEQSRDKLLLKGVAPRYSGCESAGEDCQAQSQRESYVGLLRPNIVLDGEEHPQSHLITSITEHDRRVQPDALLILGTSLTVHGLKRLIRCFAKAVHASGSEDHVVVFVNRTSPPPQGAWDDVIDYHVEIDTDAWVSDLRRRRGDIWLRKGGLKKAEAGRAFTNHPDSEGEISDAEQADKIEENDDMKPNGEALG
jgi:NAD-dependent SIR2 family protein deacetylase